MPRIIGKISPSDLHRVVKLPPETFERLGAAASTRGMSRPVMANELLNFMLDNPDIIDTLLGCDESEQARAA